MADWVAEKNARIEKARGPFERLRGLMSVQRYRAMGAGELPVYRRLNDALWALRDWRLANNQQQRMEDEVSLCIRVVNDSMASEISAAAGAGQDPATIAWVVAGLRCPLRPFCQGCDACFTVDAPHRSDEFSGR